MIPEGDKGAVPVKPALLKTRFNYTSVVPMSPDSEVSHDVAKALQLKASKLATPPAPPRPYNAHTETSDTGLSVSATSGDVDDNNDTPPAPPPRTSAPMVPPRHGMTKTAYSDSVLDQVDMYPSVPVSPATGFVPPPGAISVMMPGGSSPTQSSPAPPVPRRDQSAGRPSANGPIAPPRYGLGGGNLVLGSNIIITSVNQSSVYYN